MKYVTTKCGNEFAITFDFKGEMIVQFPPKRFHSKVAYLEQKLKKWNKGMNSKVIEKKRLNKIFWY